jgi:hypothetical protein
MQCNAICNLQFACNAICNAMQFKHGKNLQFTDGKYDKLNKYKNTMNWFTRLPCGSEVNY